MARAKGTMGNKSLAYMGVQAPTPPDFTIQNRAPTQHDSEGFNIGHIWLHYVATGGVITTHDPWMLVGLIGHQATWILLGYWFGIPGIGVVQRDALGHVFADSGTDGQVIIGSSTGVPAWANITSLGGTVVITNGPNSINLEAAGVAPALVELDADVGVALPVAGVIKVLGDGTGTNTTAAGNTLVVHLNQLTSTDGSVVITQAGGTIDFSATGTVPYKTATAITNDAVPKLLVAVPIALGRVTTVKAYIDAIRDTKADALGAEVCFTFYRPAAGNVTLIGVPIININTTNINADVQVTVDIGTQSGVINVVGIAGQTWDWKVWYYDVYTL